MLCPVCLSCNTLLADKQIPYEKKMKEICEKKLNEEQKIKEQKKLLDDLGLSNYCCRTRVISYIDQANLLI